MQIHSRTHVITLEQVLVDEVHNVSRTQPRQKGHTASAAAKVDRGRDSFML